MAAEFIQQLTHDEEEFEKRWSETYDQLNRLFNSLEEEDAGNETFKVKALDALVDYILAEPNLTLTQDHVKMIFVEKVVKHCAEEPSPSLTELVRLVRRILDRDNIFNQWYLSSIEAFHFKFELCKQLIATESFDLIQSFLESLQKHAFLNDQSDKSTEENWQQYLSQRMFSQLTSQSNKLNNETAMTAIRPTFQQILR